MDYVCLISNNHKQFNISEKTGYPEEMLELGMDMEQELGLESIKRVDIMSTLPAKIK